MFQAKGETEMKKKMTKAERALENEMNQRQKREPCLLYPEDNIKINWEIFMTIVLLFACLLTPYKISFIPDDDFVWNLVDVITDFLFLIDILVIFNTAYQNENFEMIEDRKLIAKNYLKGWFFIDMFAIIPFQLLLGGSNVN